MRIVHPQQPVNGLNPEDVFYAVDDLGAQTGYGFILYQLQPGLYPDCPVNLYFSIAGDPASRYLLFGALVARARILQNVNPQMRCRLYTSIDPSDIQMKDFVQKVEDFLIQMWVYLYRFMSHMIGQDPDDEMIQEMFGKVL